jgi:uncharacterized membrane protein
MVVGPQISILANLTVLLLTWLSDHKKYLSQSDCITAYMVVGSQISILASLTVLLLTWTVVGPQISILVSLTVLLLTWFSDHK